MNMGFFDRIKQGLKKTAQLLNTDIRDLFKAEGRLVDDAFLTELFAILVKTDMGVGPANEIKEQIQTEYRGRVVQMTDLLASVKAKLRELMSQGESPICFAPSGPTIIMIVGVNGSGKTTSIAKLSQVFRSEGKKVVLGAGDTFRAPPCNSFTIWAERVGVEIVKGDAGSDPAAVAASSDRPLYIEIKADICILDTAGRLQAQTNLMQELAKIRRVTSKLIPDAPHEVLLVLDATAGQNGISQAKGFSEAAGCTGIVLAEIGWNRQSARVVNPDPQTVQPAVKFIGVGEKAEDVMTFDSDRFVDAMFEDVEGSSQDFTLSQA